MATISTAATSTPNPTSGQKDFRARRSASPARGRSPRAPRATTSTSIPCRIAVPNTEIAAITRPPSAPSAMLPAMIAPRFALLACEMRS